MTVDTSARRAGRRPTYAALIAAALLSACSSTPPTHFYSLQTPTPAAAVAPGALRIEVLSVEVPAQVDVPQLVVRDGDGERYPVEDQQWIAPLSAELREALSTQLSRRLGATDVYGLVAADEAAYRIKVKVSRFDAQLGAQAQLDANWTLRQGSQPPRLVCSSHHAAAIGSSYAAVVAGQQQTLAALAADLSAAIQSLAAGDAAHCPG